MAGHQLQWPPRRVFQVEGAPLQPQHLGRGLQQAATEGRPVDQTSNRQTHLLHRPIELVLLSEKLPVDHPLEPSTRQFRHQQYHKHRKCRRDRHPRRRVGRKQLIADQLTADQEHARIDQPGRQAESEIDRASVDNLLDLHQLVASDAEGVGHRVQKRYAEHRPGGVAPPKCRRIDPRLCKQISNQDDRYQ